ncbi:hypothetical protein J3458_004601 [Metarhizium acridum]|uniref:uncharacterized protein n=1 Tax=Metarhizium acridum TaxID=92637 RepID=UPI001C6A9363|nr:hypothetical protein J3458_004601 [Metarhizium acridum]
MCRTFIQYYHRIPPLSCLVPHEEGPQAWTAGSHVVFRLYAIQTMLFERDRMLQHCDDVEYVEWGRKNRLNAGEEIVWCELDEVVNGQMGPTSPINIEIRSAKG